MDRVLITSALPYINGVKHLGNFAGSMLPADVYARFQRARGRETLFICATDEHGTPAELAASAAALDVRSYCDQQHVLQKSVCEQFGLSWDWFGRSSSSANRRLTQQFAEDLEENGLLEERVDRMLFSIDDNRFLPDRYVEGTCPYCAFDQARGDQCDSCGRLLDPTQLIEPYSAISKSRNLISKETRNLYLCQSRIVDRLWRWLEERKFSVLAESIARKHLNEGLRDRGITRDLSWGIPVTRNGNPRKGFEEKVFYVWFDAPIEYISATIEWSEEKHENWERWWRLDKGASDVKYVQFMGKDNVAFHTTSFPATLLGSGRPWKSVDNIKSFNWLNWYGDKFSTSRRRGVFMDAALQLLPADYWRWYLISNGPENADTPFTWEHFSASVNSDLANVLGNYINRVFKFAQSRFGAVVPRRGEDGELEENLLLQLKDGAAAITDELENMNFRSAARRLRELWSAGNSYFNDAAPWKHVLAEPGRAAHIVYTSLVMAELLSRLSAPFIPFTAAKISAALGVNSFSVWPTPEEIASFDTIRAGAPFSVPELLFSKISEDQVAEWSIAFGGRARESAV